MKFINELREGEKISGIYLCKHKQPAVTKNGKPYENVILQDKTGTIDAKIWEPNSQGIDDFDTLDYIDVIGDVTSFQGSLQVSIKRARKAHEGEYEPGNYLPISEKNIDGMYEELLKYVHSIKNAYLNKLLVKFFEEDEEFIKTFKGNSAAKTVHHGFIGGLLEHTLGVVRLCQYYSKAYPVLNRDLLITAAMLHDIGKIGIPDRILNKPERLTDEEYKEMKSHVVKGGEILKSFTLIDNIEEGALYHHERYDGKGYVHGLKGEEIPLNARIIGIADAFDAMTANRVYRKKLDMDFVLGELKKGRGTQFDPQLTDIMLHLIETGQIDMQRLYDNANVKEEEE